LWTPVQLIYFEQEPVNLNIYFDFFYEFFVFYGLAILIFFWQTTIFAQVMQAEPADGQNFNIQGD
ncbi:MAG TPA: hypothetical protein VKY57_16970, partial [Chitinispirillaceae bacterium]|nr:hypothetical protein [Chitinispirillaceae bacterium]